MKSKYQEQVAAIERRRKVFHIYIKRWTDANVLLLKTQEEKEAFPVRYAYSYNLMLITEKDLIKAAAEAQVDRYGNPLYDKIRIFN